MSDVLKFSGKHVLSDSTHVYQIDDGTLFYHKRESQYQTYDGYLIFHPEESPQKLYVKCGREFIYAQIPNGEMTALVTYQNALFFCSNRQVYKASFSNRKLNCEYVRDLPEAVKVLPGGVYLYGNFAYGIWSEEGIFIDVPRRSVQEWELIGVHKGKAYFSQLGFGQNISKLSSNIFAITLISKNRPNFLARDNCRLIYIEHDRTLYTLDTLTMELLPQLQITGIPVDIACNLIGIHKRLVYAMCRGSATSYLMTAHLPVRYLNREEESAYRPIGASSGDNSRGRGNFRGLQQHNSLRAAPIPQCTSSIENLDAPCSNVQPLAPANVATTTLQALNTNLQQQLNQPLSKRESELVQKNQKQCEEIKQMRQRIEKLEAQLIEKTVVEQQNMKQSEELKQMRQRIEKLEAQLIEKTVVEQQNMKQSEELKQMRQRIEKLEAQLIEKTTLEQQNMKQSEELKQMRQKIEKLEAQLIEKSALKQQNLKQSEEMEKMHQQMDYFREQLLESCYEETVQKATLDQIRPELKKLQEQLIESKIGALQSAKRPLKFVEFEKLTKPLICMQLENGTSLYFDNVKPFELFTVCNGEHNCADLKVLEGEFDCSFKGIIDNQAYFSAIRGKVITFFKAALNNFKIELVQIREMKTSEISLFKNEPFYFVEKSREWSVYIYHENYEDSEGEKFDISDIDLLSKYDRHYHRGVLYLFRESSTAMVKCVNEKVVRVEGQLLDRDVTSFYTPQHSDDIYIVNSDQSVIIILDTTNLTVSQLCYDPPAGSNNHSIVGIHEGILTMAFDGVWGRHLWTAKLP